MAGLELDANRGLWEWKAEEREGEGMKEEAKSREEGILNSSAAFCFFFFFCFPVVSFDGAGDQTDAPLESGRLEPNWRDVP